MSDDHLTGFIYLRRPAPPALLDPSGQSPSFSQRCGSSLDRPDHALPAQTIHSPRREDIGRLLILWLEAVDGRRPPRSLKNGRFHPDILSQLGGHQRLIQAGGGKQTGAVASKIKTLHIQKTTTPTVRFCASAVIGGRVRAIAGTTKLVRLPKKEGSPRPTQKQWRVETLQII